MLLKSLLFAMLLSDAAGGCGLGTPPHACKPRLRGTSSDVNPPLPRDDDTIERAAVSNQFNPGPDRGASRTLLISERVSSDEPKPGSRFNDARALCLHHRPASSKCPKPYTQSGPFCCFGPPMAPECYKWTD